MSVPVIIKLTTTGPSITGPFSIYCMQGSNQINPPLITGITKAQLLAGYYMVSPTGCTGLRVFSNGVECTNYIDFVITTTTSTTSTTTSTTSTTTLPPCKCHEVTITGTVDISWTDCDNVVQTFNYSNVTINVCARVGSITKTGTGTIAITQSTTTCVAEEDCWPSLNLAAVGIDRFMIRYLQIWPAPYTTDQMIIPWMIDYGDGFTASFTGPQTFNNGGPADHIYASPFTGTIKIKAPSLQLIRTLIEKIAGQSFTTGSVTLVGSELSKLENLYFLQNLSWELNADVSDIPTVHMDNLYSLNGTITGNVSGLPSILTSITLLGNETNTLSGNLAGFPSGMKVIRIDGNNTITGNVNTLPASFDTQLTRFILEGNNTISGDIAEFTTYNVLVEFAVRGFNLLTGSVCSFNAATIQRIVIQGYGSPSGNTSCMSTFIKLEILDLQNDEDDPLLPPGTGNTLTGDIANLPDSLRSIQVRGNNTLSGDIQDMPTGILINPANKIFWLVTGVNTITGDIANIRPNCNYFTHGGAHTLFGDIATIPPNMIRFNINYKFGSAYDLSGIVGDIALMPHTQMTQFVLDGNHHVNTYSVSTTWPANMNVFIVKPTVDRATWTISTPQLNQLLVDLDNTTWLATTSFIQNELYLVGTPSGAGSTALTSLAAIPPPNDILITVGP